MTTTNNNGTMDNLNFSYSLIKHNIIDLIFINFICTITILGALINFIEPYLPVIITQTFRYGKHSYKGVPNRLAQMSEIPKSWFKHFYVFALIWSTMIMYLVVHVYIGGYQVPTLVIQTLDLLCGGNQREIRTNPTITFIAILLLFIQCIRRFYETHFIQIFSSTSKMNITHYIVGYFHYFGAFLAILSQAKGFTSESQRFHHNHHHDHRHHHNSASLSLQLNDCGIFQWIAIGLFFYAWYNQFMSNLILANLRKNNQGKIITQKHLIPSGGYFEWISSPHMFFEVIIYAALFIIIYNNSSWLFVLCWVLTNQIENAWLTQKWYLTTFPEYPIHRRAIFPILL